MRRPSTLPTRYSAAVLLVGAFLLLRLSLQGVLGSSVPYLQFFPAIMLAAWLGGLGPGLLATALAAAMAVYFFLEPLYSFAISSTADSVSLPLFMTIGIANSLIIDSLRRAESAQRSSAHLANARARDLREAADAISTTRERLAQVVANVPGVVWEAWGEPDDAGQRVDFVSDYAKVMLGYEPSEWTSTRNFWLTIVHPDDRARAGEEAAAIFASRGRGRSEFRWIHRDGHVIWVEAHSQVVLDGSGQPVGMRGVTLDISERKLLERERADLLLREQSARSDAVAANRIKDDFLATLSHELRTPLNAILGYTRMLRRGIFDTSRQAHALEVVERNATTLTQMVEDVLDVSRIVAGKIRLNVEPVDLARVVDEAIATIKPAADGRGVALQPVLDGGAGPVAGDPERIQQVVWNLLSNAVKFTPRGGRVQIRLERVNSHVEIVVSDTGAGISPEFLPHVFERFRQADSRFSREYGGLGLGLAIAREIVHLHGGTIHAVSEGAGKGATFRVRLTLMIVHADSTLAPREHPAASRGGVRVQHDQALAGVRVLVVDDEPDATALMKEVLEAEGAAVTMAQSAPEALSRLANEDVVPDLLVTDIGMPEMDGFELVAELRESSNPALRDLPAAALTAYARSEDRVRALKSGFQMHLAKPIDPSELIAAVLALAKRHSDAPRPS